MLLFRETIGRIDKLDKELDAEIAACVGVDSIKKEPKMGWKCSAKSMDINKHKLVVRQCHTIVNIKI